jgi:hypothetical protein
VEVATGDGYDRRVKESAMTKAAADPWPGDDRAGDWQHREPRPERLDVSHVLRDAPRPVRPEQELRDDKDREPKLAGRNAGHPTAPPGSGSVRAR